MQRSRSHGVHLRRCHGFDNCDATPISLMPQLLGCRASSILRNCNFSWTGNKPCDARVCVRCLAGQLAARWRIYI